jgi:ABC-type antimicrobial peptide transport system permease subunit
LTVVGVVATTPTFALPESNVMGQLFMPMSMAGGPDLPASTMTGPDVAVMNYVVRTATPAAALLPSVRRTVDAFDPKLALAQIRTLQNILDRASAQMAFTMVLLTIAASFALVLGAIGIYGVMSYVVSQRTGEIGVRLALGADRDRVARMIVRQGGTVTLAGIAVSLVAALMTDRLIESLLYDVSSRDPVIFCLANIASGQNH